jgi:predicted AAA+ superfamily ATPase
MQEAFDWNVEQYLFYGGYPGAAPLIGEPDRWARYIRDSLIETTIARDVLLLSRVDKPAVLRRLFELGCAYSGQILSYTKMLGQLQDAGNTIPSRTTSSCWRAQAC